MDSTVEETQNSGALIELRHLSKCYEEGERKRVLFSDLNGSIRRHEFVALLGRSGSGKSTLLNLISGIDLPSAGEVVIDGVCLTRLSEEDRTLFRRRHIGFVFQFFNLIPTLTVEENLFLPLELNRLLDAQRRQYALNLLHEVGLAERAASYPDRLSGGEQQRLAIARALVHRPLVLLADEPTGNLDAETGRQVLNLLEQLARQVAMTVLMVTHSEEGARRADRVLTVRDGLLCEPDKTISSPP